MAKREVILIKRVSFKTPTMLGEQSVVYDRVSTDNKLDYKFPIIQFDEDSRFISVTTENSKVVDKIPLSNVASLTLLK